MAAISDESGTLKFVHTYGAGLHSGDAEPDVHDPRWQQRQVDDFVEFAVVAEELGFDGITVTEHHAPLMTCPSPHLLLAAAAMKTSRIRLGTAVTVLPLYSPIRVAEEAGMLDLLSGGRFELGLGRGVPGEAQIAVGRDLGDDDLRRAWREGLEVVRLALTERDFTFEGEFFPVQRPTTIATRPLQDRLPVWLGGWSRDTMVLAAERGWNVLTGRRPARPSRRRLGSVYGCASSGGASLGPRPPTASSIMARSCLVTGCSSASATGARCSGRPGPITTCATRGSASSQPSARPAIEVPRPVAMASSLASASKVWSVTNAAYGSGRWVIREPAG